MPGGRPRKPTHLKVVSGTAQKCRINPDEPAGSTGCPVPPPWLSERATEIFFAACADMESMGTLRLEWRDAIASYSSSMEEIELTTSVIEDLGRIYTTRTKMGDIMYRPRPEVAMRSDAMKRAHALRSELGLGPAAKSKVSTINKPEGNPFKNLG